MSCFLYVNDQETTGKINIDDLYENRQKRDLKQVSIFNKILARIHNRITLTARNKRNDQHIWFVVPEFIFGEPMYDKAECIAYLVSKLETNKFHIRYLHPNTLFISWSNWIPSYVRNEFKKKTGLILDERGNVIDKQDPESAGKDENPDSRMFSEQRGDYVNTSKPGSAKQQKDYKSIDSYKPTGTLVYNQEMFEKLGKKIGN
jgi:Family of unknown function (DUF5759)